jgi:tetratricopeptide (TPR) repeat protein
MRIARGHGISSVIIGIVLPLLLGAAGPGDEARTLWKTGKYAEAQEAYEGLLKAKDLKPSDKETLTLGLADCLDSQGQPAKALEELKKLTPATADVHARIAELLFNKGDWDGATAAIKAAQTLKADHLASKWIETKLLDSKGKISPDGKEWKWFIDYQNGHGPELSKDPLGLLIVGQAAERYYRINATGEQLGEGLNDVINTLYEQAIKIDPNCWQAHWLEGKLFLAGYQEGDARKDLMKALTINPQAAEAIVTLGQTDLQGYKLANGRKKAERAIEINPRLAAANVLLADVNISDERFPEAREAAKKAVAENPRDEESLARLAATARLLMDPATSTAAEAAALANNPKPVTFYAALAERLADRRKYHSAERAFLLAAQADPKRADVKIGLGMLYMQIGREPEARDLFDAAFDADPFNIRAKNMMKVLKHMAGYRPVNSEHYVVLVDPTQDTLLGKYMANYLESIHGELTTRFGYSPPRMTSIQIMKDHEWFSGRTVALPFIPTVGACTGTVIALASPKTTKQPFNWARVLKHELVHVITLQQTEFNIPHWYTEALAVESEGFPRPQPWNKMLLERVPARKLLNLDNINLGFIRPSEPEERQLAYCQAQLYAQYMLKRFGNDALIKMLNAYRRGLTTEPAIKACFNVEKADFEAKFLDFVDDVVKQIQARLDKEPEITYSKLAAQLEAKPNDPDLTARMAYELYARRDYKAARPLADKALKLKPKHPLASYVKARLFTSIGDEEAAIEVLKPALDKEKPDVRVLGLLAELQVNAGNLDEAESLYMLARKDDPFHTKWITGLAKIHLRRKQEPKLMQDLEALAMSDSDNLDLRKQLTDRFLAAKNFERAEHWAMDCLYIDVYDPVHHVSLGDARVGRQKYAPAVEEYEIALTLKPRKADDIRVKLARAQLGLGDKAAAKASIEAVLKADPKHPEALKLKGELK